MYKVSSALAHNIPGCPCLNAGSHTQDLYPYRRNFSSITIRKQLTDDSLSSYPCSICLVSVKGARCIQLACSHVFCRPCLQEYWGLCISEGSVERVGCADASCVKEVRLASEEEVRRVVYEKEVMRWKWLRTKKEIEKGE